MSGHSLSHLQACFMVLFPLTSHLNDIDMISVEQKLDEGIGQVNKLLREELGVIRQMESASEGR